MSKCTLWYFFGLLLWTHFVSANVNNNSALASVIRLNPDGTLPVNGSQCVQVSSDGIARVTFVTPKHDIHGGFDYDRSGLYLSFISADHGSFTQHSPYILEETNVYQEIVSSKNAGKVILISRKTPYFECGDG